MIFSGEGISLLYVQAFDRLVDFFESREFLVHIMQYTRDPVDYSISGTKFQISEGFDPLTSNIYYDGSYSSVVDFPRLPLALDGELLRSYLSSKIYSRLYLFEFALVIKVNSNIVQHWFDFIAQIFEIKDTSFFVYEPLYRNPSLSSFGSDLNLYLNQKFQYFLPRRTIEANCEFVQALSNDLEYIYAIDSHYFPMWLNSDVLGYLFHRYDGLIAEDRIKQKQFLMVESRHNYWNYLKLHEQCFEFIDSIVACNQDQLIYFLKKMFVSEIHHYTFHALLLNLCFVSFLCRENASANMHLLKDLSADYSKSYIAKALRSLKFLADRHKGSTFERLSDYLFGSYTDRAFVDFLNSLCVDNLLINTSLLVTFDSNSAKCSLEEVKFLSQISSRSLVDF